MYNRSRRLAVRRVRHAGPRLTTADVGLPVYAGGRRVSGLRREEVALLAGMSVEYYTRIELWSLPTMRLGPAMC